jgi:hypothetical protein
MDAAVTGGTPVPLRATEAGPPAALLATLRVPARAPVVVGVNVTLIVQLAPGASVAPQALVCEKSPDAAIVIAFKLALPLFLSVTVFAALVVPLTWLANASAVGLSVATGAPTAVTDSEVDALLLPPAPVHASV